MSRALRIKASCVGLYMKKAQDGFQGVDKSPAFQGDWPYIGHLFDRGQWVILAS
jgi:hypothetical protein